MCASPGSQLGRQSLRPLSQNLPLWRPRWSGRRWTPGLECGPWSPADSEICQVLAAWLWTLTCLSGPRCPQLSNCPSSGFVLCPNRTCCSHSSRMNIWCSWLLVTRYGSFLLVGVLFVFSHSVVSDSLGPHRLQHAKGFCLAPVNSQGSCVPASWHPGDPGDQIGNKIVEHSDAEPNTENKSGLLFSAKPNKYINMSLKSQTSISMMFPGS